MEEVDVEIAESGILGLRGGALERQVEALTRVTPRTHLPSLWPRQPDVHALFQHEPLPVQASLRPVLDDKTQEIISWTEVIQIGNGKTEDLTMKRPVLPAHLSTRGNSSRLPFLPSSFLVERKIPLSADEFDTNITFMGEPLLNKMSSLNIGVDFNENIDDIFLDVDDIECDIPVQDENIGTLITNLSTSEEDGHQHHLWRGRISERLDSDTDETKAKDDVETTEESVIKPFSDSLVLNITNHETIKKNITEWVEILDTSKPVEDFEKRIPNMAHKFPFELDTFQKLAILKLEEQGHVFVAAHTSAGKTVVAEYAIALSLKHCTRIIYTSPVKALSNQKYREFTRTFGDVGLITGDIQINTTASCLVMTTEILRSMLYNGSDVIRDLEYVIFDEVHYINDTQRGYVWEEVLILLPSHCGIVMLSATVPNTLEFADWVGRTKKRMVYVVSTTKRPVALCHHLYLGNVKGNNESSYLIIDQNSRFLTKNYNTASQTFLCLDNNRNSRGGNFMHPKQEKNIWIGLIKHLKKHDKLPVVVFILSRKRCDTTAENLISQDLTTAKEKSKIHMFIQSCLKKLNESDRKLPQVTTLQTLLACGIGVHHSGILPILKEVVEMLFQLGLVKILFATETFAVGVNMPARTVVFDSITKYDGFNWRALLPSEYIQMAGRAGRRGLDDTGTVIILCKKVVPSSADLTNMMLGKPSKLSSQFRVTYATMLSLLRVTNLSIENMMKCSFREFGVQSKTSTHRIQMQNIYKTLSATEKTPNYEHLGKFCDMGNKYFSELTDLMPVVLAQKSKDLLVGKVVLICYEKYAYQFALILSVVRGRITEYRVLVLEFEDPYYAIPPNINNKELWYVLMCYAGHNEMNFNQYRYPNNKILTIQMKHILNITTEKFKGNCGKLLDEYDTAKSQRTPTLATALFMQAVNLIYVITHKYSARLLDISVTDLLQGLKINKGEILTSLMRAEDYKKQLLLIGRQCTNHNFYTEFPIVFRRKEMEWKYDELERLLSSEEMTLYPEYQRRLEVLKELRYIDAQHHVAIKGRVACELGKNELMITEIVFRNILTDLDPAEIAALLSCLVVEARIHLKTPQKFTEKLEARIQEMQYVDEDLTELEKKYQVGSDDPLAQFDRLNFGLVNVIYEWAQGKSFCDIIKKTDVQEGIIVHSIQKLHEVLMNVKDVAKIIGDPILQSKMDEASLAIKRDIVFALSLYTQDDVSTNFATL